MKRDAIRRQADNELTEDRISDIRRGSDVEGFDGFVEPLQWTAAAVHGSDIRSAGRTRREWSRGEQMWPPSEWTVGMWRQSSPR